MNGSATTRNWATSSSKWTGALPSRRRGNALQQRCGARLSQFGEIYYQAQTSLGGGYLFGNNFVDGALRRFSLNKEMKENRVKPLGEWNHYEMRAQGSHLTLSVNGAVVNELPNCACSKATSPWKPKGTKSPSGT